MKTPVALALCVAVLLAIAGVAGYAAVNHWTLPFFGGGGPTTGALDVYVQDTPAAVTWSHLYVTFSEILAHAADQGNESGWHNLTLQTTTVDLASLVTVSQLVGSGQLASGKYTQLRIVVESAKGAMSDGTPVDFTVPSGELRTADPFNITTGRTTSMTVQIDLGRSIVQANGTWYFLPVLGAVEVH